MRELSEAVFIPEELAEGQNSIFGCFHTLGILYVGVLVIRARQVGLHIQAAYLGKLPYGLAAIIQRVRVPMYDIIWP